MLMRSYFISAISIAIIVSLTVDFIYSLENNRDNHLENDSNSNDRIDVYTSNDADDETQNDANEDNDDASDTSSGSSRSIHNLGSFSSDPDYHGLIDSNVDFETLLDAYLNEVANDDSKKDSSLVDLDPIEEEAVSSVSEDDLWVKKPSTRGRYAKLLTSLSCPDKPVVREPGSAITKLHFYRGPLQQEVVISEIEDTYWDKSDVDSLVRRGLDVNKKTLIYLGGWLNDDQVFWLKSARTAFDNATLANGGKSPYNLLIFNWKAYGFLNYGKAVGMVPHLGEVMANLFEQLVDRHNFKPDLLHIISYSLSTHIAGLSARQLREGRRGRVGQITALDPTGVCFHRKSDKVFDREYSLRPTDAKLVVARHYNMGQLGAGRPIGGIDIMVNGGSTQPRMFIKRLTLKEVMGSTGALNGAHHRAAQHEEEPFNKSMDCHEVAYACSSAKKFRQGQCAECGAHNESCYLTSTLGNIQLGLEPTKIKYKLNTEMHITTGVDKFCAYHYQVIADLKQGTPKTVLDAFKDGSFKFEVGKNLVIQPKYFMRDEGVEFVRFSRLLRTDKLIKRFPARVKVKSSLTEALKSVQTISINFMSNIFERERTRHSFKYCPDKTDPQLLVGCWR